MRFVPVELGCQNATITEFDAGGPFLFAPTSCAIDFDQPPQLAYAAATGDGLDFLDGSNYTKIERMLWPSSPDLRLTRSSEFNFSPVSCHQLAGPLRLAHWAFRRELGQIG